MKKALLLIMISLATFSFGQKYVLTTDGLKDSENNEKTFLVVKFSGKKAKELYERMVKYADKNFKAPNIVMKDQVENESMTFKTNLPSFIFIKYMGANTYYDVKFTTEINFKDDRIKFEVKDFEVGNARLKIPYIATKESQMYGFYDQNKTLKMDTEKQKIEDYFAKQIQEMTEFLNKKEVKADEW
jgi:Domain of unknown function (DUF4468) with TBP-like fold